MFLASCETGMVSPKVVKATSTTPYQGTYGQNRTHHVMVQLVPTANFFGDMTSYYGNLEFDVFVHNNSKSNMHFSTKNIQIFDNNGYMIKVVPHSSMKSQLKNDESPEFKQVVNNYLTAKKIPSGGVHSGRIWTRWMKFKSRPKVRVEINLPSESHAFDFELTFSNEREAYGKPKHYYHDDDYYFSPRSWH